MMEVLTDLTACRLHVGVSPDLSHMRDPSRFFGGESAGGDSQFSGPLGPETELVLCVWFHVMFVKLRHTLQSCTFASPFSELHVLKTNISDHFLLLRL